MSEGYDVAYDYTVRSYPRFFTWTQFQINSENSQRQGGGWDREPPDRPARDGPEYKVVVAINDDTIYAEAFLDVSGRHSLDRPLLEPAGGSDRRRQRVPRFAAITNPRQI